MKPLIEHEKIPKSYWLLCFVIMLGLLSELVSSYVKLMKSMWSVIKVVCILLTFPLSVPSIAAALWLFKKLKESENDASNSQ